jgi:hypothetical protein
MPAKSVPYGGSQVNIVLVLVLVLALDFSKVFEDEGRERK